MARNSTGTEFAALTRESFRLFTKENSVEAASDAVKKLAEQLSKDGVSESTSLIVTEAVGAVSAAFAGAFASNLLKAVLKVSDPLKARLDRLIAEPFITGRDQIERDIRLQAETSEERRVKEAKILEAAGTMDRAYSMQRDREDLTDLKFYIRFVQGLCSSQITAGRQLARDYFGEVRPPVADTLAGLRSRHQEVRGELISIDRRLSGLTVNLLPKRLATQPWQLRASECTEVDVSRARVELLRRTELELRSDVAYFTIVLALMDEGFDEGAFASRRV